MPINFEALLSSSDVNNTFVDKNIDQVKTGVLGLQKNVGDTTAISDLQVYINFLSSVLGVNGEADPNANVYSSNNYISNGDDRKVVIGDIDAAIKVIEDALNAFIATKGAALGLAELDATGRLPSSQLSLDSVELKGTFDPNTDTLTNGVGTNGDYYIVSADGSYDFGAGSVSMLQNDSIIYFDSTATYERLSGSQVRSINGSTGDVQLIKQA